MGALTTKLQIYVQGAVNIQKILTAHEGILSKSTEQMCSLLNKC